MKKRKQLRHGLTSLTWNYTAAALLQDGRLTISFIDRLFKPVYAVVVPSLTLVKDRIKRLK